VGLGFAFVIVTEFECGVPVTGIFLICTGTRLNLSLSGDGNTLTRRATCADQELSQRAVV
jgi:hypothetical protein